jgi:hypothetical protein
MAVENERGRPTTAKAPGPAESAAPWATRLTGVSRDLRCAWKGQAIEVRWSEGRRSNKPAIAIFLNPHHLIQKLCGPFCGKSPAQQAQRERCVDLWQRSKMNAAARMTDVAGRTMLDEELSGGRKSVDGHGQLNV